MDPSPSPTTLYVFMDESGNFDFSARGTDFFVLSAVYTSAPGTSAQAMQALKYDLMAAGSADLEFHATNNSPGTRLRVFDTIAGLHATISAHTIYLDKHFAHKSKQSDVAMMSLVGGAMGKWICRVFGGEYDQIVLVFDSVLRGKAQGAFNAAVKPELKKLGVPFRILFHPVKSDMNGQIADYISWAWFRRAENNDLAPESRIRANQLSWDSFDLFARGTTRWY